MKLICRLMKVMDGVSSYSIDDAETYENIGLCDVTKSKIEFSSNLSIETKQKVVARLIKRERTARSKITEKLGSSMIKHLSSYHNLLEFSEKREKVLASAKMTLQQEY